MSAVHSSTSQAVSPSQANGRDGDGSHRSLRRRFRKLEPVFELAGRIAMIGFGLGALYFAWRTPAASIGEFTLRVSLSWLTIWFLMPQVNQGRSSEWRIRFFAVHVGLIALLAVLEAGVLLRLLDGRDTFGTFSDEPWARPENRLDQELLHVRRPNLRMKGVQHGGDISFYSRVDQPRAYRFDLSFDERGFRNPPGLKSANIAVVGDSFVEADTIADDRLLTARLAERTGKTVANLGQLWYGPQQIHAVLKRHALPLKPKTVLWVCFEGNDLSDLRRYDAGKADLARIQARQDSLKERSFSANLLKSLYARSGMGPDKPISHYAFWLGPDGTRTKFHFYYRSPRLTDEDEVSLERMLAIFRQAAEDCRREDAKLIIAMAPTKFRVMKPLVEFSPDEPAARWEPNDLPQRLARALASFQPPIEFIDLTEPLRTGFREGKATYFTDDTHWSEDGHDVVARALADRLNAPRGGRAGEASVVPKPIGSSTAKPKPAEPAPRSSGAESATGKPSPPITATDEELRSELESRLRPDG